MRLPEPPYNASPEMVIHTWFQVNVARTDTSQNVVVAVQ